MNTPIRHDHEVLLENLLKGKLPRNLRWSEVIEFIELVGKVEKQGGDEFAFQVGTQRVSSSVLMAMTSKSKKFPASVSS